MPNTADQLETPSTSDVEEPSPNSAKEEIELLMRGLELDEEIDAAFLLADGLDWGILKEVCEKRKLSFQRALQYYLGGTRADWHLRRRHAIQRRLRDEALYASGDVEKLIQLKHQDSQLAKLDAEIALLENVEKVANNATADGDPIDVPSYHAVLSKQAQLPPLRPNSRNDDANVIELTPIDSLPHDDDVKARMLERAHSTTKVIENLFGAKKVEQSD